MISLVLKNQSRLIILQVMILTYQKLLSQEAMHQKQSFSEAKNLKIKYQLLWTIYAFLKNHLSEDHPDSSLVIQKMSFLERRMIQSEQEHSLGTMQTVN